MTSEIVDALESVESAVQSVEQAVGRVESAVKEVKDKWSTPYFILMALAGLFFWSVPSAIWHAKWRYALANGVSSDHVTIIKQPHDCNFLAAPLGAKYCEYERQVTTVRWSTSTQGQPIVSWDEGKTWNFFTPEAGETVPKFSTVREVFISWDKKEN
jgi:hypothetical protein